MPSPRARPGYENSGVAFKQGVAGAIIPPILIA